MQRASEATAINSSEVVANAIASVGVITATIVKPACFKTLLIP
jgi:hypothetical protein